jgi:hypothetical protein
MACPYDAKHEPFCVRDVVMMVERRLIRAYLCECVHCLRRHICESMRGGVEILSIIGAIAALTSCRGYSFTPGAASTYVSNTPAAETPAAKPLVGVAMSGGGNPHKTTRGRLTCKLNSDGASPSFSAAFC